MGRDVPATKISQADRRAYREKVRHCLDVLALMLRESRFETEPQQVGVEIEDQVRSSLNHADREAAQTGTKLAMIGILPTLRESDVDEAAISANPRYRLLNEQIFAARGEEMDIRIDGVERLETFIDTIAPEAACTSVQFHLQVSPESFGNYWNAAQALAGVQVALGANSPFLFGRELWAET